MLMINQNASRVSSVWTPRRLFASNEVGAWYDPSDLTTLFQDTAGTTPVTTPGQTVALMLDKSQLLVRGSELVVNGDFSDGVNGWTGVNGATITAVSGGANVSGFSNAFPLIQRSLTTVIGKVYEARADFVSSQNSVNFSLEASTSVNSGSGGIGAATRVGVGNITFFFRATTTTTWIKAVSVGVNSFVVDNISVRELSGNHATQAITAQRPTYGIEPMTGRRNLLTFSEQFNNAAWIKNATTVTVNTTDTTDPTGGNTACRIDETAATTFHNVRQEVAGFTAGTATVYSFYAKAGTRQYGWFGCYSGNGAFGGSSFRDVIIDLSTGLRTGTEAGTLSYTFASDNVGNGWFRYRVVVTATMAAGSIICSFGLAASASSYANYAGSTNQHAFLWGTQLETGSTATAYQRVTTQFDVNEAGVASKSYLRFDGVDDGMATGTITPGSVDKAQVFAGVRKLTDATQGMIVEYSATVDTNNGTFFLMGARSGGGVPNYGFRSKGTTLQDADATGYTAPITNVLGALGDISGDRATLRVNATQVTQSTGDQGTGNYLAYPLYIGRRGGTSLPFNGHIYGLIVRFSATNLDAATIGSTETWLNRKTAAY